MHRNPETQREGYDFQEVVAWLGHTFSNDAVVSSTPVAEPPTPDELLARAKMLNQFYGGTTVNGTSS